jgi:hypothetical protein
MSTFFWDIIPCIPLKINILFKGTYSLYLQGRRISHARNQQEADISLFFYPENGSDVFL